ncbi:hypothetical protein Zm00014a_024222 [Zea mays]|jgi:hypothetical protein|uniref:Serine/arginine repetitive matrix protein 1-like n=2 Tax=Zea mays TaxID=4577 RepID=A0A8J8Y1S1_MAIZE|nr:serine/arginine repetitive matrix protein 1 [Zea mays]AQK99986.1 hypothetical protein ZEAMMB73_Zm00001d012621 [Zea mays]PWZ12280.1 hypothetical protein Zm00014a_024222 [Zea mays]|eukprot:XP_008657172.1 serine/arginine repetitive matrix protein 1 [Zea mays]
MGCCFSKNPRTRPVAGASDFPRRCGPEDRDPPSPEEETVKEVLSETPSAKPRANPKLVGNAVVPAAADERKAEKAKKQDSVDAAASDVGSCVSLSLATDERSEAASESSVATSSVAGPERSPRTKPARRRPASADLGPARRERDRAVAASYGVRSRSARASASPPPRHVPRDRSVRRSPSPAAKRRASSEPRRAASPTPSVQRKPPVPARPAGRVSPRRRAQEATPRPASPPPPSQLEDDAVTAASEPSIPDGSDGGDVQSGRGGDDGKESLENPLVSLECFIFL